MLIGMLGWIVLLNLTLTGSFMLVTGYDTYALVGTFKNSTYLYDYNGNLIKKVDIYGYPSYSNGYYVITNNTKVYLLKEDGTLSNITLPFSSQYSVMGAEGIVSCANYCALIDNNGKVLKTFLNTTTYKVVTSWDKYITVIDWNNNAVYLVDPSNFTTIKTINVNSPMWATNCGNYLAIAYRFPDRITIIDLDTGKNVTILNATATALSFDDNCEYLASAEWYYMRGRVYSLNGSVVYEVNLQGDVEFVSWKASYLAFSASGIKTHVMLIKQTSQTPSLSLPWMSALIVVLTALLRRKVRQSQNA